MLVPKIFSDTVLWLLYGDCIHDIISTRISWILAISRSFRIYISTDADILKPLAMIINLRLNQVILS